MSQSTPQFNPADYAEGEDRYVDMVEDVLGITLAETQKEILRAAARNPRILIISGNGVGKSYAVACLILAFLLTNLDSIVLGTSGSYSQFQDAMWKPLRNIFKRARERHPLPGQVYRGNPPKLAVDDDWYAKAVSPQSPGDLEGRHAADVMVVIEEADKRYIDEEHFDSAGSSITDLNDRFVAIANPPDDETNVVWEKRKSDRWHVIQFSSFEAHNVRVDAGEIEADRLPGIVDLLTLASDWEDWNQEPWPRVDEVYPGDWPGMPKIEREIENGDLSRDRAVEFLRPGFSEAKIQSAPKIDPSGNPVFDVGADLPDNPDFRTDLDNRWYKRRAGIMPPDEAGKNRPIYTEDVDEAVGREPAPFVNTNARGVGIDVARKGGDNTVVSVIYDDRVEQYGWSGVDHKENYSKIVDILDDLAVIPHIAIDAIGEGSGLADDLRDAYGRGRVTRFKSGTEADQSDEYNDKWTESLVDLRRELGRVAVDGRKLTKELYTASRCLELEYRHLKSGDVLRADPKSDVAERLGRSPDRLDSFAMAAWAARRNRILNHRHDTEETGLSFI